MPADWGLEDWADLADHEWPNLLVGNGLSIAVSPAFTYSSLYAVAGLDATEQDVFHALQTTNFERVLDYLRIARVVCQHLHGGGGHVHEVYGAIRQKLIAAVNNHHVSWNDVPAATLGSIRSALRDHRAVWTTSYDLIPYWAIMSATPAGSGFADAFWHGAFDPADALPNDPGRTRLWWPHGALHLYRLPDGSTVKRQHTPGQNLLELLGSDYHGVDTPLFVSEGTSADKLGAIRRSDYLNYAYTELALAEDSIVVFGQGLSVETEKHLIDAIGRHPGRMIAYGIFANDQATVDFERARIALLLPNSQLRFFDSRTHPLAG